MLPREKDSELESRLGKRLFKLWKTVEIYGETGSIKDTAQIMGITQETVERRLSDAVREFENARRFLKEVNKYKYVLFRKETAHSKRIGILCRIGKTLGYKTWIGYNERSYFCYVDGRERVLGDLSDFWKRPKLLGIDNQIWNFLKFIDTLWIRKQKIHYAFEIETTTSFIKAFDRCSNIPFEHHAVKVIAVPRKRKRLLLACIQSNLILHEIKKGNWYLLDFRALERFDKSNAQMDNFAFSDILDGISP